MVELQAKRRGGESYVREFLLKDDTYSEATIGFLRTLGWQCLNQLC